MAAPASPPLDAGLTRAQKARLHEVADLMLQIYQLLARARYISASWIQPGPHDLTAQLPLYHSLGLDPRIIYLYSILPYLAPERAAATQTTFFNSSPFVDFRKEEDVREAHDFVFRETDPRSAMRPWTTALSGIGLDARLVVYEARRHVVFFVDNNSGENTDFVLDGVTFEWSEEKGECVPFEAAWNGERGRLPKIEVVDKEAWDREKGFYDLEEDDDEDYDEEDEGEDENEEEEEDDDQGAHWDDIPARLAGHVLRDMLGWFRDLVIVPGCTEWDDNWSEGQTVDNLPLWEWRELRSDLRREQRNVAEERGELEVAEPSARPLIEERMRQAEESVAILQQACAACQADGNLSPTAMAAEIAREVESLTRELEECENRLAAPGDWMPQLPEGAAQARDLAQQVVDELTRRADRLRKAIAWELEWPAGGNGVQEESGAN
ncbi:hypothetical protein NEMBOFW57_000774 [Staphylotrichum longicolle]|uniref:Uncharacterized protein n=1 Tax=Staphylotrichum longicolle TaxID=669026 RepID=A0AAD4EZZ8_9PEZI|nr:hypothetical protein NEMBOFW57_000774 [Staphylotrichum longicolle]